MLISHKTACHPALPWQKNTWNLVLTSMWLVCSCMQSN